MARREEELLLAFRPPRGVRSVNHVDQAVGIMIVVIPYGPDLFPSTEVVEFYLLQNGEQWQKQAHAIIRERGK